jgi:hypothetical protein
MATADMEALAARMQQYVDDPSQIETHSRHARESAVQECCWKGNSAALPDQIAAIVENTQKERPRPARRLVWAAAAAIARVRAGLIASAKGILGNEVSRRATMRSQRGAATRSQPSPLFAQTPGKRNKQYHMTR